MRVAIVGHEKAKFTAETEARAREVIRHLLTRPGVTAVVSGRSPVGGIDIWAEEIGEELGLEPRIYPAERWGWPYFRKRNLQIAGDCDQAHCIVVQELPPGFTGWKPKEEYCYHCVGGTNPPHVKSGGCWTVKRARIDHGVPGFWHVI